LEELIPILYAEPGWLNGIELDYKLDDWEFEAR
jgi:hypothetical protein